MDCHAPALLRAYPELAEALPRVPLVEATTPVAPFPVAGVGEGRLFVKSDAWSNPLYGGNKPRKLEWLLGAARAHGARRLVTTGGLGTHHGLATTVLGASVGLATTLVMVDQPIDDEVVETLALQQAYGAEQVYGGNVAGAALQAARVLARSTALGEKPRLIATGGSSAVGDLGFVSAGLELAEQVRAGELEAPSAIYLPVGSGGTMAGLVLGLALAGLRSAVRGVLVTDILPPSPARLQRQARATLRLLRRHSQRLRDARVELPRDAFGLVMGHVGPGYGAATPEASDALQAAAAVGVELETTYSAKCLAAVRARAADGRLEAGPLLFWNTFSAVDVAARAPRPVDPAALPPAIARRLQRHRAKPVPA